MRVMKNPISVMASSIFAFLALPNTLALAGGPTASITLQPVPPKTVPPSSYPPGTTIVGQEIILGSVPARVWFEIHYTGWAPEILKTLQVTIDGNNADLDGGGYSGANAECMGAASIGAGNLAPAMQPCNVNADCRSTMSGIAFPCITGEPSRCLLNDGTTNGNTFPYFPQGPGLRFCEPGFQYRCDPEWGASGIAAVAHVDISTYNYRFGFSAEPGEIPPDFHPSYAGTLVIDVPANAKGSYTIDFKEDETFLQNPNNPPEEPGWYPQLHDATITILCGRCCFGVGGDDAQCVEGVSANECATYAASAVFQANEDCPDGGGSECPLCALVEHCDDGIFCNGVEICDTSGECRPGPSPCGETDICHEDQARCAPRIPTMNVWGMLMMTMLLLIAAKLSYRKMPAARGDSA